MNRFHLRARALPVALCAAACMAAAAAARAQERSQSVDQVTIRAQRLDPTAPGEAAAREAAARVPGGSNVVGLSEYEAGRASNLGDVFAYSAGVFVQPRFGAEESRLSIRGSGLQRTFHLRGIYLLQDGVPITLADGGADFQAVEPLALAYTEVLRGANALQYGGATLGGSINFVSPSGHDGAGPRVRLEGGSFGYRRALLSFGDAADGADFFVSLSAYEQDGFRDWAQQAGERFFGNAALRLREGLESRFFLAAVNSDSRLPGALTLEELRSDARQANAGNLTGRQKRDFELYRLANRTVVEFDAGSLELSAGYSYKDLWHPIFQVLKQRSHDSILGARYVGQASIGERPHRIVAGVVRTWSRLEDDRFANVAGAPGARTAESLQRARNLTLYAEDQIDLSGGWTLAAGLQWTDALRRYDDHLLANGDQGFEASYSRLSPKLGFLWRARSFTIFGNVSDSFEPPSFGELTGGPGVDLLDEQRARTVEIGTRGGIARVQWDLALYSARVRGELLSLNTPDGQPLGTVNAPRTLHRGVELALQIELARSLSWRSAHLWNDFRFDGHGTYGDNVLPGIPRHFHRGELTWSPLADYFVTLAAEWSPSRYPIDMANSWFAGSYALWGLKIGRNLERGLSWFVEGRNLADRRYAATTGVIADARGSDVAQFFPGDGRAVYAGVTWRGR